jgi:hypothetical protein
MSSPASAPRLRKPRREKRLRPSSTPRSDRSGHERLSRLAASVRPSIPECDLIGSSPNDDSSHDRGYNSRRDNTC